MKRPSSTDLSLSPVKGRYSSVRILRPGHSSSTPLS
jgi:hypothetical protein